MSKKHHPAPIRANVSTKNFPADCHVLTPAQREVPTLATALAEISQPQPSERARREVRPIIAAGERPAPTVREDLQAVRRRPWDAPMATPTLRLPQPPAPMVGGGDAGMPDPFAQRLWDTISAALVAPALTWWERAKLPAAFTAWSLACFWLGRLV